MSKRFQIPAAVALLAILALTAVACGSSAEPTGSTAGGDPTPAVDTPQPPPGGQDDESRAALDLSLGDGGALASCIMFDVAVLADMSPAFAGTATSVEDESVTLTIDRWYTGDDAAAATLRAPAGLQALIGGIDFEVGEQYLITAADGNVNYCGFSGVATPELTAAFEEAFGS